MNLRNLRIEDMSNLYPSTTGVEVVLWASPGFARHKPRVKVGRRGKDASVSIEDEPKVLAGKVSESVLKQISKWILLNKELLLRYWNEEIDTKGLTDNLKKI